jgi:hypothetical protein
VNFNSSGDFWLSPILKGVEHAVRLFFAENQEATHTHTMKTEREGCCSLDTAFSTIARLVLLGIIPHSIWQNLDTVSKPKPV